MVDTVVDASGFAVFQITSPDESSELREPPNQHVPTPTPTVPLLDGRTLGGWQRIELYPVGGVGHVVPVGTVHCVRVVIGHDIPTRTIVIDVGTFIHQFVALGFEGGRQVHENFGTGE